MTKSRLIHVRCTEEQLANLDAFAKGQGVNRAVAVRMLVNMGWKQAHAPNRIEQP